MKYSILLVFFLSLPIQSEVVDVNGDGVVGATKAFAAAEGGNQEPRHETPNSKGGLVGYTDQTTFLSDLSNLGLIAVHEGFEEATAWGGVRSGIVGGNHTAPSVSNHGVSWSANNGSSEVTTGGGAARIGDWGFYSLPHGSFTNPDPGRDCASPGDCGDGFRGSADSGVLYAVGGWFRTNTPFAELGMFIGTYPENPVDFGETCDAGEENCSDNALIGTQSKFFGVIDAAGFTQFEFRELEGTAEDAKFIFADDFYLAGSDLADSATPSWWLVY